MDSEENKYFYLPMQGHHTLNFNFSRSRDQDLICPTQSLVSKDIYTALSIAGALLVLSIYVAVNCLSDHSSTDLMYDWDFFSCHGK